MSAATTRENSKAKDLLANIKSGVLLKGTVRSHSANGSAGIAWIGIQLPALGERVVLIKEAHNLRPGQIVVIQCVPNPSKPEHYMFRIAAGPDSAGRA